jgi:hypothetical protein
LPRTISAPPKDGSLAPPPPPKEEHTEKTENLRWRWIAETIESISDANVMEVPNLKRKSLRKSKYAKALDSSTAIAIEPRGAGTAPPPPLPLFTGTDDSHPKDIEKIINMTNRIPKMPKMVSNRPTETTTYSKTPSVLSRQMFCETRSSIKRFKDDNNVGAYINNGIERFPFTVGAETISERLFLSNGYLTEFELFDALKSAYNDTKGGFKPWWPQEDPAYPAEQLRLGAQALEKDDNGEWIQQLTALRMCPDEFKRFQSCKTKLVAYLNDRNGALPTEYGFGSAVTQMRFLHFRDLVVGEMTKTFAAYTYDDVSLHVLCVNARVDKFLNSGGTGGGGLGYAHTLHYLSNRLDETIRGLDEVVVRLSTLPLLLAARDAETLIATKKSVENIFEFIIDNNINNLYGLVAERSKEDGCVTQTVTDVKAAIEKNIKPMYEKIASLRSEIAFVSACAARLFEKASTKTSQRNKHELNVPTSIVSDYVRFSDVMPDDISSVSGVENRRHHVRKLGPQSVAPTGSAVSRSDFAGVQDAMVTIGTKGILDSKRNSISGATRIRKIHGAIKSSTTFYENNDEWRLGRRLSPNHNNDFGAQSAYIDYVVERLSAKENGCCIDIDSFYGWYSQNSVLLFGGKTNSKALVKLPNWTELQLEHSQDPSKPDTFSGLHSAFFPNKSLMNLFPEDVVMSDVVMSEGLNLPIEACIKVVKQTSGLSIVDRKTGLLASKAVNSNLLQPISTLLISINDADWLKWGEMVGPDGEKRLNDGMNELAVKQFPFLKDGGGYDEEEDEEDEEEDDDEF